QRRSLSPRKSRVIAHCAGRCSTKKRESPTERYSLIRGQSLMHSSEILIISGMSYWMTTHWPRLEGESTESSRSGVWVQHNKRHLIDRVSSGDLVFIYETRSGRAVVRTYAGGSNRTIARHQGR